MKKLRMVLFVIMVSGTTLMSSCMFPGLGMGGSRGHHEPHGQSQHHGNDGHHDNDDHHDN